MLDPEANAAEPTENDGGTKAALSSVPLSDIPLSTDDPDVAAAAAEPTENDGGTK
jgi:hypothetical protein